MVLEENKQKSKRNRAERLRAGTTETLSAELREPIEYHREGISMGRSAKTVKNWQKASIFYKHNAQLDEPLMGGLRKISKKKI